VSIKAIQVCSSLEIRDVLASKILECKLHFDLIYRHFSGVFMKIQSF
jgi:hypothetical protein